MKNKKKDERDELLNAEISEMNSCNSCSYQYHNLRQYLFKQTKITQKEFYLLYSRLQAGYGIGYEEKIITIADKLIEIKVDPKKLFNLVDFLSYRIKENYKDIFKEIDSKNILDQEGCKRIENLFLEFESKENISLPSNDLDKLYIFKNYIINGKYHCECHPGGCINRRFTDHISDISLIFPTVKLDGLKERLKVNENFESIVNLIPVLINNSRPLSLFNYVNRLSFFPQKEYSSAYGNLLRNRGIKKSSLRNDINDMNECGFSYTKVPSFCEINGFSAD